MLLIFDNLLPIRLGLIHNFNPGSIELCPPEAIKADPSAHFPKIIGNGCLNVSRVISSEADNDTFALASIALAMSSPFLVTNLASNP